MTTRTQRPASIAPAHADSSLPVSVNAGSLTFGSIFGARGLERAAAE